MSVLRRSRADHTLFELCTRSAFEGENDAFVSVDAVTGLEQLLKLLFKTFREFSSPAS